MQIPGRDVKPDVKHNSKLLAKLINYVMLDGKKTVAERTIYKALEEIEKRNDASSLEVFTTAVANCSPRLEVRTRRVGGANYQVPMQVNSKRQLSLGLRWIIDAVRSGKGSPISQRLAAELMAAFRREGTAMTTRENVHRMAEANKAFAHFAW